MFCVVLSSDLLCCLSSDGVGVKLRKAKYSLGNMDAETSKKPSSDRSAKDRRNTLLRVLDGVLSLSHRKTSLLTS
jgi:hypothetical protein